jgi:hypothetical protein
MVDEYLKLAVGVAKNRIVVKISPICVKALGPFEIDAQAETLEFCSRRRHHSPRRALHERLETQIPRNPRGSSEKRPMRVG